MLNGQILTSHLAHIDRWDTLCVDGKTMQAPRKRYYMVNKPVGYVSATNDEQHPTVLSLLPEMLRDGLHIAGRLDKNTTGLLLLTNDGRWSRAISSPASKVGKDYLVGTRDKITEDYVTAFAQGMYFSYEGITTQPATLRILGERLARLTIYEGKYHQIKRMFGRFRNPV
ncbi:MAG: pseudouridine synthase, partial [Pontibacterium sp.]